MPSRISTHALREEGDGRRSRASACRCYFYPRPPRGGRPIPWVYGMDVKKFLPTPSARRATTLACRAIEGNPISTHALREEGDHRRRSSSYSSGFLPTPSARRATQTLALLIFLREISTHALREEGDLVSCKQQFRYPQFLPTPSARRATEVARS